jgi:predicted signal transduction protein with EAL and GGDEF domain
VEVEALVRWENPQDGMILLGQFIGLAEESSLIDNIARQVVRNALVDSTCWKDLGT